MQNHAYVFHNNFNSDILLSIHMLLSLPSSASLYKPLNRIWFLCSFCRQAIRGIKLNCRLYVCPYFHIIFHQLLLNKCLLDKDVYKFDFCFDTLQLHICYLMFTLMMGCFTRFYFCYCHNNVDCFSAKIYNSLCCLPISSESVGITIIL